MKKIIISLVFLLILVQTTSVLAVNLINAPNIKINLISQDPDPVKQGDVVEVRFKIENNGTQTIDDVKIELLPDYPFSLYSGNTVRDIGRLPAAQSGADTINVDYKLKVDEKAVEGDNEIALKVIYGERSQIYNDNEFTIDVEKYDLPDMQVYIRESSILNAGEKGNVVVEIANSDIGDARFVQLTLLPSENYQILSSSNYVYLGDIDSDDTESEEFEIYVDKDVSGVITLPVKLEYQDTNEQKYEKRFDLRYRIFDEDELETFGVKERSLALPIFIALILILAVYVLWKQRKRKKK